MVCKSPGGLTRHIRAIHREFTPANDDDDMNSFTSERHPHLTGKLFLHQIISCTDKLLGSPCNANGNYLPAHTPPPLRVEKEQPWEPFESRSDFDFAHFHFVEMQSPASKIDKALNMWAANALQGGADAPWKDADELYATIDAIQDGDSPWKVYKIKYSGT
jgi:hypothetical protein